MLILYTLTTRTCLSLNQESTIYEMNSSPQHSATTLYQEMNLSADKGISTRDSQKLQALRIISTTSNKQKRHSQNTKVTKMDEDWQRTSLIVDWMEKKKNKKKRISSPPLDNALQFLSSSSSSHSSSSGFSSSECESVQPKRNMDSCFPPLKQKQISTSNVHSPVSKQDQIHCCSCSVPIHSEMPSNSKSAALKMYADLKISNLPISPGGKLTRFFDSILKGTHRKLKATKCSSNIVDDGFKHKPQMSYTCSSTSSSTRSCLVKKSPTQFSDKSVKKSVRFYPTSIENSVEIRSRNVEHSPSSIYGRKDENLRFSLTDDYRGACEFLVVDDDTDDAASDTSSELFEIDHIIFAAVSSNSNGNCNNELPVFETTNVNSRNRAISNTETVF